MGKDRTSLCLVILAAGMGTRFGGDKPLAAVGPEGQSLFEYSVYDAVRAGFNHVVFVVNDHQDTTDFTSRLKVYGSDLKIDFVIQALTAHVTNSVLFDKVAETVHSKDASLAMRKKPWGTAHAVLVCREYIHNPFVVINADDYHGRETYRMIAGYLLQNQHNPETCVLAGYRLENTLSTSGGVNRGICQVGADGYLESIQEVRNISRDQPIVSPVDQSDGKILINNDTIVSMTFWGFVPSVFSLLYDEFAYFLTHTADPLQDEFYIPDAVNSGIRSGLLNAMVLETSEMWKGLTYVEDLPMVRDYISKLTESGDYRDIGTS